MFTKEDIIMAWEILSAYAKDLRDMGYHARNREICEQLLRERCSAELAELAISGLSYIE